jgi:hypothetical protein
VTSRPLLALVLASLVAGCQAPPQRLAGERRDACVLAAEAGRRLLAQVPATFDPTLNAPAFAVGAAVSTAGGVEPKLAVLRLRLKALGERQELARHLDCSAEFARQGLPISPDQATLTRLARQGRVLAVRFGRPVRQGDWAILEVRKLSCRPAPAGQFPLAVLRPVGPVRLIRHTPGGWTDAGGAEPGHVRDLLAKRCAWSSAE